jgi:hypothetical protein
MKYRVTGADKLTGEEITRTFEAPDPVAAEALASQVMFVSEVNPLATVPPHARGSLEALEYAAATAIDADEIPAAPVVAQNWQSLPRAVYLHDVSKAAAIKLGFYFGLGLMILSLGIWGMYFIAYCIATAMAHR